MEKKCLRVSLSWAFCEMMRKMNQRLIVLPEGEGCFGNPGRYVEQRSSWGRGGLEGEAYLIFSSQVILLFKANKCYID